MGKLGLVQIWFVRSVYTSHACARVFNLGYVCVRAAWRGMTALVGEGERDVISIGKCYHLRGLFTLISLMHTNKQSILYTPIQTLLPFALIHTFRHTVGPQWGRDYQTNLLWYTESSLTDNKAKSTHHLLSLASLCWFRDKTLVIQSTVCFYNRLAVPGLFCSPACPPPGHANTVDAISQPCGSSGDSLICIPNSAILWCWCGLQRLNSVSLPFAVMFLSFCNIQWTILSVSVVLDRFFISIQEYSLSRSSDVDISYCVAYHFGPE